MNPSPLLLLSVQILSSFIVFGMFARFAVVPWLRRLSAVAALTPLLWVHAFRYIPLALMAPSQTDGNISLGVLHTIAGGDFLSAIFSWIALVSLYQNKGRARLWIWVFSVVSTLDILVALTVGLASGVHEHRLGVAWYILTLYVPLVCASQFLIFRELRRIHPVDNQLS